MRCPFVKAAKTIVDFIVPIRHSHREKVQSVHRIRSIHPAVRMAVIVTLFLESAHIGKHTAVLHVVAVQDVPLHILAGDEAFARQLSKLVTVAAVLPRIVHDGQMSKLRADLRNIRRWGVKEALVGNLGLMLPVRDAGLEIRGDFGLNIYNSMSMLSLQELELKSAMLSFEMTLPQVRDISKPIPAELLAYGRLPLMVTENCLIRGKTGECACHLSSTKLVDKTGAEFPVIRDGASCRSVLLNGKKLNWLDRQKDLNKLGLWAVRLYFTTENPQEVDRVLQSCVTPTPFDPGACTRGLYLRGLD